MKLSCYSRLAILSIVLLLAPLAQAQSEQATKSWIYFTDKGPSALAKSSEAMQEAHNRLTARAVQRRLKVRSTQSLIDDGDLAIYPPYLDRLQKLGISPIYQSRWLNAVTAYLTPAQEKSLQNLSFISEITPVRTLAVPRPVPVPDVPVKAGKSAAAHRLDYGESRQQNEQINIPALHDVGISGDGVMVGLLDAGFSFGTHEAFDSLRVLGQYDFIFADSVTANEDIDHPAQHNHGTQVLSIIAGYAPGKLIGPAYKASYYLSKTEDLRSETPVEEDFWLAGIEWMEAQGIDVASSSLGYTFYDNPEDSHTYEKMDGRTTVVTRAAQMAVDRGVVVVNSAGNSGSSRTWPYMNAPSDGIDVIAAGALDANRVRASFSSIGPTYDGRIKPDVMAMGVAVRNIVVGTRDLYQNGNGTSYSCPLIAGVAALILSAHPDLTPLQINEALRLTASQAAQPDNENGYGTVDARAAATYWGPVFGPEFKMQRFAGNQAQLTAQCLLAANDQLEEMSLHWRLRGSDNFQPVVMVQRDLLTYQSVRFELPQAGVVEFYFSVDLARGDFQVPRSAPGALFELDASRLPIESGRLVPESFALAQNYPNPMSLAAPQTEIRLLLMQAARVELRVFNLLGQEVANLLDASLPAGIHRLAWDGRSASGGLIPAGIYFYRARFRAEGGQEFVKARKIVIVQ